MDHVVARITQEGFKARLHSFSALDRFCGLPAGPHLRVETDAELADLARLFGELRFPGPDLADAAVEETDEDGNERAWYFRCGGDAAPRPSFDILGFAWDAGKRSYIDPGTLYPIAGSLRDPGRRAPGGPRWFDLRPRAAERHRASAEAAIILSRYPGASDGAEIPAALPEHLERLPEGAPIQQEEQRVLLSGLMTADRPQLGLSLLKCTGFLSAHWPELEAMDDVDHSKEFHPEGNAWEHTLETFRYRKIPDLTLSLGLLLHDAGKALAEASGGRRFDRHAELGELTARDFMGRLGFSVPAIERVAFLVRNHMMPAALPRLPLTRTQAALESPLFPLLLELYRCDESSSFKDQGGFYESCAAYRTYLRNVKNPYRSADGKKMMKRLFS